MSDYRAKVYRNIERRQEILGLEPIDAVALLGCLGVLMFLNRHGAIWNFLFLSIGYVAIRIAKRGKPEGHTTRLLRFYTRRPYFSALAPDIQLSNHPFLPESKKSNSLKGGTDVQGEPGV